MGKILLGCCASEEDRHMYSTIYNLNIAIFHKDAFHVLLL